MSTENSQTLEYPSHIPADRVLDFNFFDITAGDGDVQKTWYELQQNTPDIFWTPHNGGHWVATRAEDIKIIQADHERFSMKESSLPRGRRGIPSPPIDLDPPEHFKYRKLIAPFFLPKGVAKIEPSIHDVMQEVIERVAPQGECEFMSDVAKHLPIVVFLRLVDLPLEDREMLLDMSEAYMSASNVEASQQARRDLRDYMVKQIEERRQNPRGDVISSLVQAEVDGAPMAEDALQGMCTLLLSGGLDTVKSMLGFTARTLATHPKQRRQLVEDPSLIPTAVEEFIRRQGITNTARLITHDFEFKGLQFKKGEQIQIPNSLVGLDPDFNDNPLELDFSRKPVKHGAFGSGPHLCPGAALARTELRIFLEYWLKAIPDFELNPDKSPVVKVAVTNSVKEVWLTWK